MCLIKQFSFLLVVSLCGTNLLHQFETTLNSSFIELFKVNSSENVSTEVIQQDAVFDNNYSAQIIKESDIEFHHGPQYDTNWTFIGKEKVRVIFSLYSLTKISNETKINRSANLVSIPSRSLQSIYFLKYFLFTIRQYKTNTAKILKMEQLVLKTTSGKRLEHFSNSLLLIHLNPKEKYSICIYYYQMNISTQMPDLFICQDIVHDHSKHSVHGLLFILTQYSIILGILIVLQGLFSMRKRRLAHIVHQHLINKSQRLCSRLSSVSLIRQSFSSMDTTIDQQNQTINGHQENKFQNRIISSSSISFNDPSNNIIYNSDENEPFLKLTCSKNHVHFLLDLDEGSDDNQSDITLSPQNEPYGDRSDALLSVAHILDTNKPWSKYSHHTGPV